MPEDIGDTPTSRHRWHI